MPPPTLIQSAQRPGRAEALPAGYNGAVAGNEITRAGCWSHARRKIIEAEKAAPEIAQQTIEIVRALYAVEKQAAQLSVAERLLLRQSQSAPVLAQLRQKLLHWKELGTPQETERHVR